MGLGLRTRRRRGCQNARIVLSRARRSARRADDLVRRRVDAAAAKGHIVLRLARERQMPSAQRRVDAAAARTRIVRGLSRARRLVSARKCVDAAAAKTRRAPGGSRRACPLPRPGNASTPRPQRCGSSGGSLESVDRPRPGDASTPRPRSRAGPGESASVRAPSGRPRCGKQSAIRTQALSSSVSVMQLLEHCSFNALSTHVCSLANNARRALVSTHNTHRLQPCPTKIKGHLVRGLCFHLPGGVQTYEHL